MARNGTRSKKALMRSFKRALVLADSDMNQFAKKHDVSQSHLYRVLVGERQSEKLMTEIRAVIEKHLPNELRAVA